MSVYLQHGEPNSRCMNFRNKYLQCGMNTMKLCLCSVVNTILMIEPD